MAALADPDDDGEDWGRFPLLTHTLVLGADIAVSQRRLQMEQAGVRYPLNTDPDPVQVEAMDAEYYLDQRHRRYLAAWARRVLFSGAPTDQG